MKKQTPHLLATIAPATLHTLTTIVAETLAADSCPTIARKVFTTADLWHIQKQRRNFVQRRYL